MGLVEYAERELHAAGLFDTDQMYGDMLGKAALEIVKVFADQGHSGMSAPIVVGIVQRLMMYKPLSALTGEDDEWTELNYDDHMVAQNKRYSSVFKRKDGTAYNSEGKVFREPDGCMYTSKDSWVDITFPYEVPERPEIVDVPYPEGEER